MLHMETAGVQAHGGLMLGDLEVLYQFVLSQRDWFLQNFDNDLVANIRNGAIYYWEYSGGTGVRAKLLSATTIGGVAPADVPDVAMQILVSQNDKHLLAFGCTPFGGGTADPLLIRFATQDQPNVWTPLSHKLGRFLTGFSWFSHLSVR